MLARVAKPDPQPVMRKHLVIELDDERELTAERRRLLAPAGFEIARHLARKPRTALRGASDHDRIGAGGLQCRIGVVEGFDIAIDHDGNGNRVLHCAHRRPIGVALVELAARAAMHGDHTHARLFCAAGEFRRVDRLMVPAEPHLQRHRHRDGGDGGFNQRERMIEVAHQRRSRLPVGHVLGRAAHVDVDHGGAGGFRDARALAHPVRFASGKLHHMHADALTLGAQDRVAVALHQIFTGGHFGNHQTGTETGDQTAERGIGHA
jgi:hypothetical protein